MSYISPNVLNILLMPTFLNLMSNSEIYEFINSVTPSAKLFKYQVLIFRKKMLLSKQYNVERKIFPPIKVEWEVLNQSLIISASNLLNYYNFYNYSNDGFAFILKKVLENKRNNEICQQMREDNKECCCKKVKDINGKFIKKCLIR
jgi:hypothetical protein